MSATQEHDNGTQVPAGLEPDASVPDVLKALKRWLTTAQLATSVDVSPEAVRQWANGSAMRPNNRQVLDSLRETVRILVAAGAGEQVGPWMTTSPAPGVSTPLEVFSEHSAVVIDAAKELAEHRPQQAIQWLEVAGGPSARPRARSMLGTMPSSTEVKRQLLTTLLEISNGHASADEVLKEIEKTYRAERDQRPNYRAVEGLWEAISERLTGGQSANLAVADLLVESLSTENELERYFMSIGRGITGSPGILTYALSMRVIQALHGVSVDVQSAARLYVGECRVKSLPDLIPFADAVATLRRLEGTNYEPFIVLDADAPGLIREGKIDYVLLGAQAVLLGSGPDAKPEGFIATAGTSALLQAVADMPREGRPQVWVLAEKQKEMPKSDRESFTAPEDSIPLELGDRHVSNMVYRARLVTMSDEECELTPDIKLVMNTDKALASSQLAS